MAKAKMALSQLSQTGTPLGIMKNSLRYLDASVSLDRSQAIPTAAR
jgi:hypothetical protein